MSKPPESPYFGLPEKKPDKSKDSEFDSRQYLKERGRQLLLKDDEIEGYTLTKHEKEVLTMNHEISMAYTPTDVILTENGWVSKEASKVKR
ncbi:MAG: hypothetical protein ABSG28_08450 [Methanoregula sp.]|jgi:hypothetical protein|uniref:hypothetical protein n=1 Tax=Methanoregula sp. TaxID=2052170 RepID=UPI003C27AFCC